MWEHDVALLVAGFAGGVLFAFGVYVSGRRSKDTRDVTVFGSGGRKPW